MNTWRRSLEVNTMKIFSECLFPGQRPTSKGVQLARAACFPDARVADKVFLNDEYLECLVSSAMLDFAPAVFDSVELGLGPWIRSSCTASSLADAKV